MTFDPMTDIAVGGAHLTIIKDGQDGALIFSAPRGCNSDSYPMATARNVALLNAAAEKVEAGFVFKFGRANPGGAVEMLEGVVNVRAARPRLVLALSEYTSEWPSIDRLAPLGNSWGTIQRPALGYCRMTVGGTVAIHAIGDTDAETMEALDQSVRLVERDFAPFSPIEEFPENVAMIDLTDGRLWSLSGVTSKSNLGQAIGNDSGFKCSR
ncbi:hypothetical protein OIU34_23325 [Pararhizobium sp. BT-229]|uniref:hypothetical protein n=1 Tax=Pararhizobium sp. BT-229 TaxID=2986923 RepID=UPI0021F70F46|nr:hypothetical protein [Pararhizobium sp. BT-229]MCV9964828.1 hypothetical protein [Pararhizobium sp. BT-229]